MDLTVFYLSDSSIRGGFDPGFGRNVAWDLPLLKGYKSVFLKRESQPERRWSLAIPGPVELFKREKFDCVMIPGYSRPFEWQVLLTAKRLGVKVIMRGEFAPSSGKNPFKRVIRRVLLSFLYRQVDAFAVIGTQARRHLVEHGVRPERMASSPYAVDPGLFSKRNDAGKTVALRKEMGFNSRDKVVLFSGKLIPRKRPETLIEAIGKLSAHPEIKALLLGDGKSRQSLKALADRVAPNRVRFAGFVNQTKLKDYFALADVFVLPSEYETWGLVVNEAMHCGLPVMASNMVGCIEDLVAPRINGYVFPVGDSTTLASNLKDIFQPPQKIKKYSRASRKRIARFTPPLAAKGIRESIALALETK